MASAGEVFEDPDLGRIADAPAVLESEPDSLYLEHVGLRSHAEKLEHVLRSLAASPSQAAKGLLLLDDFRSRLWAHLSSEEREGVLEAAAAEAPRLSRQVERLRSEHGELRARMDRLMEEALIEDPVNVYSRFATLRTRLLVHEQAENEVVQRACLDDLGVGD